MTHPVAKELQDIREFQEYIRGRYVEVEGLKKTLRYFAIPEDVSRNAQLAGRIQDVAPLEPYLQPVPEMDTHPRPIRGLSFSDPWKPWQFGWRSQTGYWTKAIRFPWNILIIAVIVAFAFVSPAISAVLLVVILAFSDVVAAAAKVYSIRYNRTIKRQNVEIRKENEERSARNENPSAINRQHRHEEYLRLQEEENRRVELLNEEIAEHNAQVNSDISIIEKDIRGAQRWMEGISQQVSAASGSFEANWAAVDSADLLSLVNLLETGQAASLEMACNMYNAQKQAELEAQERAAEEARLQREAAQRAREEENRKKRKEQEERQHRAAMLEEQRRQTAILAQGAADQAQRDRQMSEQIAANERRRKRDADRDFLWRGL